MTHLTHCVKRVSLSDALAGAFRVTQDDAVSDENGLPPKSAPLAERLAAAMERSDYPTQRGLAEALGTDGSLVGKWLGGKVLEVKSVSHRRKLPRLLKTPTDYFSDPPRSDRLAKAEAGVADLRESVLSLLMVTGELMGVVQALGGTVPDTAIEELARATRHMRLEVQPS